MGFDWALQQRLDLAGKNPLGGKGFFVDSNAGVDKGDGRDEQSPWKSLNYGLARSNADIAASPFGWTARNRIYVKSDDLSEDLVLLAQKTDIIGMGHYDRYPYALLIGNHVPVGVTASFGTRFFNMMFKAPAAGGDMWTLTDASAWLAFVECLFSAQSTTAATGAIVSPTTPPEHLQIVKSKFMGRFSDAVIEIAGTGSARGLLIEDCEIEGADVGIEIGASVTESAGASLEHMRIKNNLIVAVGKAVLDSSSLAYITRNNCFSDENKGTTGFGILTGALDRMQDNRITGGDVNNAITPANGSL